jgi:5-methylcytosine-specific restriction endonuclease McrA
MRCKSRNDIQVGHIRARSKFPELALEPSNLVTLCQSCNLWQGVRTMDFRPNRFIWDLLSFAANGIAASLVFMLV